MASTARAKRYAQAVFQIAQQSGEYDKWLSDLETLGSLKKDNIYYKALEDPALTYEGKARLLRELFSGISPMAVNLVSLLIERRILGILPGIRQEFQGLLDAYRGIERATVSTAIPLDDDERRQLEDRLENVTGKKVAVTTTVNPALIGGIVVRFGGKLLDGSTRSKLEALKREIGQIPR